MSYPHHHRLLEPPPFSPSPVPHSADSPPGSPRNRRTRYVNDSFSSPNETLGLLPQYYGEEDMDDEDMEGTGELELGLEEEVVGEVRRGKVPEIHLLGPEGRERRVSEQWENRLSQPSASPREQEQGEERQEEKQIVPDVVSLHSTDSEASSLSDDQDTRVDPDERTPILPSFFMRSRSPAPSASSWRSLSIRNHSQSPSRPVSPATGIPRPSSYGSVPHLLESQQQQQQQQQHQQQQQYPHIQQRPSMWRSPTWRKSFIFSKRKSGVYEDNEPPLSPPPPLLYHAHAQATPPPSTPPSPFPTPTPTTPSTPLVSPTTTGTGMRVWYEDYTTIDWIHDTIKERVRLRTLRSIPGARGWMLNHLDAAQAWILLAVIGVAAGGIASGIDIAYTWISDHRAGYCEDRWWDAREKCCGAVEQPDACTAWIPWSSHLAPSYAPLPTTYNPSYLIYTFTAVLLAALSALITTLSNTFSGTQFDHQRHQQQQQQRTEPTWVTDARTRRGLRRSPSKENARARHAAGQIVRYQAAGSGIPEVKVILGGFVIQGFLGVRTLVVKVAGLILSISSGLVVGAQGPLVHISCCVGNVASRMFTKYAKNEGKRREILSASSAAGVAVAFGAPLGGVLFALEEVSYYFPLKTMWRSFFCALVAAVTVRLINPLGSGQIVLFQVQWEGADVMGGVWRAWEIVPFAGVGILGGLWGALFIKATAAWGRVRARTWLGRWPVVEVMLVALVTGAISYLWDLTRIGNSELVAQLFSQCTPTSTSPLCTQQEAPPSLNNVHNNNNNNNAHLATLFETLGTALLVKIGLTIITFGIRIPGGVFIPTMGVGALGGRMVGVAVRHMTLVYPAFWMWKDTQVTPGVYAVVGAAAAVSGVTRMTVSLTVIMLELTGSLPSLLPTMLAIMLAKWTGDGLAPRALFETLIVGANYPYLDAKRGRARGRNTGVPVTHLVEHSGGGQSQRVLLCDVAYSREALAKMLGGQPEVVGMHNQQLHNYSTFLHHHHHPDTMSNGGHHITTIPLPPQQRPPSPQLRAPTHPQEQNPYRPPSPFFHQQQQQHPPSPLHSSPHDPPQDDAGFPILDAQGLLVAYIGAPELAHAISLLPVGNTHDAVFTKPAVSWSASSQHHQPPAIPTAPVSPHYHQQQQQQQHPQQQQQQQQKPTMDLSPWMNPSPLTVPHTAPLDLATEMFVKLGVKTVCVTAYGRYVGTLHKKHLVAWVRGNER